MLNKFSHAFHIPGTLSAAIYLAFPVPSDCILTHIGAVASNATDATFTVGTSSDTDGILTDGTVGQSYVPDEFELADFDGALLTDAGKEYPRLEDGDVVRIAIDHDGDAGTAAQNVTLVLTFCEG